MSTPPSVRHLEALQCHYTWDLSSSRGTLLQLRDKLLDICPEESNPWRGHIYNLLGFLQTRLGCSEEALSLFNKASEALRGPALLVNYSDLAWFHHERGEPEQSQKYLQRVEELSREYPTEKDKPRETDHLPEKDHAPERDHPSDPTVELLHPEVLAEKAWTLMKLGPQKKQAAVELFERALEEQPDHVEWRSSQAIALMSLHKHHPGIVAPEELLKVQRAHQEDPENLYLYAEYLCQRVRRGEQVEDEAAELVSHIVESAQGSYSGLKAILRYYRHTDAVDVGIFWAEEALEKHPDSRYVKRCAALCYKWRVMFYKDGASQHHLLEKGVSLLKEVISLYPKTALVKEIDLADLYGKLQTAKGTEMYQTLLQRSLEPPDMQMLFNRYAKHLQYNLRDIPRCIEYHTKAILIEHDSFFKQNSIKAIKSLKQRGWDSVQADLQSSSLSARLEELQCHFTWELERSSAFMFSVRDRLEDFLCEESNPWRGHIYNLLGFIHTRLEQFDKALSLLNKASEALRGPALLVNYSNLAWLHHKRGEYALSQDFLRRVEELSRDHPAEREQLHPEVFAEKAWTLMELCKNYRLATQLFVKALESEDRAEWHSCHALALLYAHNNSITGEHEHILKQIKQASEQDPENLQLRAEYLSQKARKRQDVGPEAAALATQVLMCPDRLHRDIKSILKLYRSAVSVNAAVDLAVKALAKRPNSRYLKASLAMCYKWKILQREAASQELIDDAVALLHEVISLYPDSCFKTEIDLANIYAKSNHSLADANRIYNDLLQRDLDSSSKQILYNSYVKFLIFDMKDSYKSTLYHLKTAEITLKSYCRSNSIKALQKIQARGVCDQRLRTQVDKFLLKTF